MATVSPDRQLSGRSLQLTSPQLFWLVLQAAALLGILCWQFASAAEQMKLFWSEAAGIKMAASAGVLIVLNFVTLLGGCYLLNRSSTSALQGQLPLRRLLLGLLYSGCFVCFYLPAAFVLLIGPTALAIQATLLKS